MPYFRKKPVLIEAIQFTGTFENFDEICDAFGTLSANTINDLEGSRVSEIFIQTLEGRMRAEPGDWIIKDVEGELYPCRDSIFRYVHEEVTPPPCFAKDRYPK